MTEAEFASDGVVGDYHRGRADAEPVLLQDHEALQDLNLAPGGVMENVTVRGATVNGLPPGTRVVLGGVILEVTRESRPCARMDEVRPGLRAELRGRRGTYARVVEPGVVTVGDPVAIHAPDRAQGVPG
jgi:MOSC domain-containing protein YiiM